MWQAIIAKQEDNLYYLLKFFAESLDDDILKEEKKDLDANLMLAAMNRAKRKVIEEDIPKELKEIKDAITAENKDLMAKLGDAQKPKKPSASYTKGLSAKQKEINEIESQIRSMRSKQKEAKGNQAKQIKEQLKSLEEKSKKEREEYSKMVSSYTRKITEESKKIADKLEDNKNTLKEINEKIKESKKLASQEEFDNVLLAYIKQPSKENLQRYLDIIQDSAAIARYVISFEKGKTFGRGMQVKRIDEEDLGYKAVEYSEKLKEVFDAQLRSLGLGTLKPEEVLSRIKARKEVETINKPLNQVELVSTLFNDKDMKELKRLIADSKEILDANTQERNLKTNIELPYPKGSEPKEHFKTVLNSREGKKLSATRIIHDAHRGAVYRIYELLKKIYTTSNFSETKKKTARKLMSRLQTLTDEMKQFKVDLKTSGFKDKFGKETEDAKRARGIEEYNLMAKDSEFWNKLVSPTIEFYSQMLEDIDLTKQQADAVKFRTDVKRKDTDESNEKEIKSKMQDFANKVARNEDFRESVSLILENFYNESSAKSFISETLFDKDKGSIYVPEVHRDKITEENKEKLLDAGMELFAELNQTVNFSEDFGRVVYYNDRINDILEGIQPKKFSRLTFKDYRLNRLLEDPKGKRNALEYVKKYILEKMEKLVEERPIDEEPEQGKKNVDEEGKVVDVKGVGRKGRGFEPRKAKKEIGFLKDHLKNFEGNLELAEKIDRRQKKIKRLEDSGPEEDEEKEKDRQREIEEAKEDLQSFNNEVKLPKVSFDFDDFIRTFPPSKKLKSFVRIFKNKRTQNNLKLVGLGGIQE
tara:strand:+ start:1942 stop:4383 length:2442 start_codon:yes stop_codon:yes gene_type:complete